MVEYVAVACAACGMCQVQQDKKASKWKCVVCGARQTLQKVLARGASRDLRSVVQELNMTRGQAAAESPPPPPPPGEGGFGSGEATGVRGLDVPKEAAPEGGWGEFLDGRSGGCGVGGGGQVSDEESEADTLPQPPAAPRAAASRRASRSSRSSALTARSTAGGSGSGSGAATARKRRFEESEVELLARRPDAEREWKRQRLTPSTPCQSPQLAGLNGGGGGACGGGGGGGYAAPSPQRAFPASSCVAYAQEQQPVASLYPRWTVGRQGEASSPPPSLPPPPQSSMGAAGSVLELQSGLGSMSLVGGMEGRVQPAKSSSAAPWADFLDDDDDEEGGFTNNRGPLLA